MGYSYVYLFANMHSCIFYYGQGSSGFCPFSFSRPKDHLLEKNKKTRKDVVTYHYRNRSWILCHQNSPCVFPDWTDRVRLRAVYHAECPAVQWEILCVWNRAADAGEKQDFQ